MMFFENRVTEAALSKSEVELPESLRAWIAKPKSSFVEGQFVEGGESFPNRNPATDEILCDIQAASESLVRRAVVSARHCYERGEWARRSVKERAEVVRKIGDLILKHRATLAILESLDTGKPISESFEGDIPRAAANFHFFAEFASCEGESAFRSAGYIHLGLREPLGVAALITPWNLPLYLETWKIAPALVMGNSVVLKPSELTPLTATYLCELMNEAGVPAGVFNCIHGFGENAAGEWLVSDPDISAISFTGETGTGRAIMRNAAQGPTKVSFELGGKGASVLFADCALDQAVKVCLRSAFRNQGEICLATPRFYVEEAIYDRFMEKFVAAAQAIRVGHPLDFKTQMGALISKEHLAKVEGYLDQVQKDQIACGGNRLKLGGALAKGNFLSPTVLVDLDDSHPVSREEVFGPVVSIYRFDDENEVVERVNQTPYGLSASIFTTDLGKAQRVGRGVRKGLVWVNDWFVRDFRVPFGGQKKSGIGREGGRFSLDFFSEWKSLCLPM